MAVIICTNTCKDRKRCLLFGFEIEHHGAISYGELDESLHGLIVTMLWEQTWQSLSNDLDLDDWQADR